MSENHAHHIQNTYLKKIEGTDPFGKLLGSIQRSIAGNFESSVFKGFYSDDTCIKCGFFSDIGKLFSNRKIRELITIQSRIRLEIMYSYISVNI